MSEKLTATSKLIQSILLCERDRADIADLLNAEVAAAEERGRRRGLEERDELRDALTQLLVWADRVAPRVGVMMNDPNTGARDLARKILAPRDSGRDP